ncbi:MAG: carbohydrate-binding domain-containing protein [Oscillospiraceae bacterium]|nr:carbohydrate-binding domain-containing protein [Oscillospiraceae bacterium]
MLFIKKIKSKKHRILSVAVASALLFSVAVQFSPFLSFADPFDEGGGSYGECDCYYYYYDDEHDPDCPVGLGLGEWGGLGDLGDLGEEDSMSAFGGVGFAATSASLTETQIDLSELSSNVSFDNWSYNSSTGVVNIHKGSVVITGIAQTGTYIQVAGLGESANITLRNATINGGSNPAISINVSASATIVSEGVNTLTSSHANGVINIADVSFLTIEGYGALTVKNNGSGHGIRSGERITIKSGEVNIEAGSSGVGILGNDFPGTEIRIQGGTVTARGNATAGGVGITGYNVNITGGVVTAKGSSSDLLGIQCHSFSMNGNAVVYLSGNGDGLGAGSGSGPNYASGILFNNNQGTVYGDVALGRVTADYFVDNFKFDVVSGDGTLTILDGATLTIPLDLELEVQQGFEIINRGNFMVLGTIDLSGTITNHSENMIVNGTIMGTGDLFNHGTINGNGTISDDIDYFGLGENNLPGAVDPTYSDWNFDNGVLTINDQDAMDNWQAEWNVKYGPILTEPLKSDITSVVVAGDVGNIPNDAFAGCTNIEEITFLHATELQDVLSNITAVTSGSNLRFAYVPNLTDFSDVSPAFYAHGYVYFDFDNSKITATAHGKEVAPKTFVRAMGSSAIVFKVTDTEALTWKNNETVIPAGSGREMTYDPDTETATLEIDLNTATISAIQGTSPAQTLNITVEVDLTGTVVTEDVTTENNSSITTTDESIEIELGSTVTLSNGETVVIDASNIYSLVLTIDDENGVSTTNELIGFLEATESAEFMDDLKKHIATETEGRSNDKETVVLGLDISLLLTDGIDDIKIIDLGDGLVAATFALPSELAGMDILFLGIHKNSAGGTELLKFTTGVNMFENGDGTITLHMSKFSNFFLMGSPKAKPAPGPMIIDGSSNNSGGNSRGRGGTASSRTVIADSPANTHHETENTDTEEIENTDGFEEENGLTEESGLTVENSTTPPPPPPPPPPTSSSDNFPTAPTIGGNLPSASNSSSSSEGSSAPSRTRTTSSNETSSSSSNEEAGGLDEQEQSSTDISEDDSDDVYYAEGIADVPNPIAAASAHAVSPVAGREGTRSMNTTIPMAAAAAVGVVAVGGGTAFVIRGIKVKKLK